MEKREVSALAALQNDKLDRRSFVPLYYQLQEELKQHIEAEVWRPGDLLPSEPALAKHFGVSRVVVRRALAILADDNQIRREQGRGTYVAPPKVVRRAEGLSRLLSAPRPAGISIVVLDVSTEPGDLSSRQNLDVAENEALVRVTTQLMADGDPYAILYSSFRLSDVEDLKDSIHSGRPIDPDLTVTDRGVSLDRSQIMVETSQCGQFEADRFDIPHRSPVFLVLCTEYCRSDGEIRPFEVVRAEYRGDNVRLQIESGSDVS